MNKPKKTKPSSGKEKPAAKPFVPEENGKKKVLHVGCGMPNPNKLHQRFRGNDWQEIRLDLNPDVEPDIVNDIRDMSSVPTASMDAVWSSHNVEHLYPHDVNKALKEFFRVVREGGLALVTLPDLQTIGEHIAAGRIEEPLYTSPSGPIYAIDMLYGFRKAMAEGNLFMAHKNAFTATTLGKAMREAGFSSIRVHRGQYDLWAMGYKYPANHPERVDRIMVFDERLGASGLADELDRPPALWKPLNIGKKSA